MNPNGSEKKLPAAAYPPGSPSPAWAPAEANVDAGSGEGKRRRQLTPNQSFPGSPQTPPPKREPRDRNPSQSQPDMSVLVHRVDLYDSGRTEDGSNANPAPHNLGFPPNQVGSYAFETRHLGHPSPGSVAVCRVPPQTLIGRVQNEQWAQFPVVDRSVPNPYNNPKLDKYWNQRRRLFSRFDQGVQLDEEGWYSVTPEQIADHVASRLVDLCQGSNIVVLDAFCGCGGNAIAFAKQPNISVIAVDLDRSKLRKAAHNAALYDIPPNKLLFIECNVLFIIEHCFRNGVFVLDQPIATPEAATALMAAMPPPVPTESCKGYSIGGIDMLPRKIDAVFLDPPWGGVDYEVFGKTGYDLARNMRIQRPARPAPAAANCSDGLDGSFFDSFKSTPRNKQERKAQFNSDRDESNCVNGSELLALAAAATGTRWVLYDVPRNTNRVSLGQSALAAGYRGNCKLEEHYLNGRLKTVTAYLGSDWSPMVQASDSS
jgi:trimethylguanosine synthase